MGCEYTQQHSCMYGREGHLQVLWVCMYVFLCVCGFIKSQVCAQVHDKKSRMFKKR